MNPDRPFRGAVGCTLDDLANVSDPPPLAAFGFHPVFAVVEWFIANNVGVECRFDSRHVSRVHTVFPCFERRRKFLYREAQHRRPLFVELNRVSLHIPVPDAEICPLDGQI